MKKITTILVIIVFLFLQGCKYQGVIGGYDREVIIHDTDIKTIEKLFPSLEGIETTEWERIELGDGQTLIPGPSDYIYEGYIVLSDKTASKYANAYSWVSDTPKIAFSEIEQRDCEWQSSELFIKDIIPGYYNGKMWRDGNILMFSISTT